MSGTIPNHPSFDLEQWSEWAFMLEDELGIEVVAFYPGLTIKVDAVSFDIPEWLALRIIRALERK